MAKAKAKTAKATATKPTPAAPATEAAGKQAGGTVEKLKEFGKKVGEKVKAAGAGMKEAETKAASHVSRNRAAYIAAGGAGLAV